MASAGAKEEVNACPLTIRSSGPLHVSLRYHRTYRGSGRLAQALGRVQASYFGSMARLSRASRRACFSALFGKAWPACVIGR